MYKVITVSLLSLFFMSGCGSNIQPKEVPSSNVIPKKIVIKQSQIIWDGSNKYIENDKIIKNYIEKKYPKKVDDWNKFLKKKRLLEIKEERIKEINKKSKTINSLMWQDDKESINTWIHWYNAKKYCNNLNLLNYNDWYLPSREELKYLYTKKNILNNMARSAYWSSTTDAIFTDLAWSVKFNKFRMNQSHYPKYAKNRVRCVRAIQ